ncbi:glycosyl transferase [Streptomyces albus subsp. albus]|nr:glycosyl transferase [Streptomyces albus subsp. albus]
MLAATAVLYLWTLGASGYANQFYSAAAQAGGASWKAFFFGSSDAANSITVDKPPAALWPMALSVRLFGLGSWSILVPEALMGVAAVGLLYAAVRRHFGPAAGLLAGGVFAVTPVAALMFRFNNPDALLCLLMVAAGYCVLRALEAAGTRWLLLAGVCFGLGFLTKTLQSWLILPPLALVYAVCAPTRTRRRLGQLLLAGLVMVVSGGWWVAIVELMPAADRPYAGGSRHNSFLELTFGYNGLGRLNGEEAGSVGGGGPRGGGGGRWGETGIDRLFSTDIGGQIGWLLPAALVLLAAGLWLTRRAGRTDLQRAALCLWGGALLVTGATFSFMSGIFHQYYTVALAPYVAALVGMGAALLWQRRSEAFASVVLGATVAGSAWWAYVLLDRTPDWLPWLRWAVLAGGLAAGLVLPVAGRSAGRRDGGTPRPAGPSAGRSGDRPLRLAAGLGLVSLLAGPVAYTLDTVGTAHGGSIVTAGPAVAGRMGGPGGGPGRMPFGDGLPPGDAPGARPGQSPSAGSSTRPGARPNQGGLPPGAGQRPGPGAGGAPGGGQAAGGPGRPGGGMGGLLGGSRVGAEARAALLRDAGKYTWVAAAVGSQNAAGYQLATERPVMAIGGFNGSDPSPTLARFRAEVAKGRIHYFIASDGPGGGAGAPGERVGGPGGQAPGGGTSARISGWVTAHFTKVTVGGSTLYDLTRPR